MSVLHSKTIRDNAELSEANSFVQVTCVDVRFNNSVELKNFKADFLCLSYTIKHELFADMLSSALGADGIARVADMSAAPDVVGVQNV